MSIILISLFTALILHGHLNVGFRFRLLLSKATKKPMRELILKEYKVVDCFPCLSFWIACTVALVYALTADNLYQFDWEQVLTTFIIASIYDKI